MYHFLPFPGKELTCNPNVPAVDLKILCQKLRGSGQKSSGVTKSKSSKQDDWRHVPDSAYDLLKRLLELDPQKRITAEEALQHSFFEDL